MKGIAAKLAGGQGVKVLIAAIGLCVALSLIFMDGSSLFDSPPQNAEQTELEARLSSILSNINGAGVVNVMIYDGGKRTDTTWQAASSDSSEPVGVIVVADGANDIRVRLELIRAVQTLLGIKSSSVEVFERVMER